MLREVWEKDLDWVELGSVPQSPRLLEIFLDRLAAKTMASAAHLFDSKYEASLSQADIKFRDELIKLAKFVFSTPQQERENAAWIEVEKLLTRLNCKGS